MTALDDQINDFEVRFAARQRSPEPNQVVIFPENAGWNDFGFKIKCGFQALAAESGAAYSGSPSAVACSGSLFLGFLANGTSDIGEGENQRFNEMSLREIMTHLGEDECGPGALPNFFTMLPDMAGYRAVVSLFGPMRADNLLRSINDLVVFREMVSDWYRKAISTEVFSRGFMRNSEPFFAFHNAGSVLSGVSNENRAAISKSIDLSFSLAGFDNPHKVQFRFASDGVIPRRINILIGKNGLGKSQTLKAFCKATLDYGEDDISFIDRGSDRKRPMINRMLALATPGETRNTFPRENIGVDKVYYRRLQLTRNGRSKSTGDALVQLVRQRERIGESSRWEIFIETLGKVLPVDDVVVATESGAVVGLLELTSESHSSEQAILDMWNSIPAHSDPRVRVGGSTFPLSSGQLTFFNVALLCALHIEVGSFVLIAEPETHMHPNMVADFIDLLDSLLEKTGSQAILATHSAYFVREVPRRQVHVFQRDGERGISVGQPRLSTFGATLDSISQFVFNEDVEVRLTDKIFENAKKSNMSFEQLDEELSDEISLAALMDLKRRFDGV